MNGDNSFIRILPVVKYYVKQNVKKHKGLNMTLQEFIKQFTDYIENNGNQPTDWYSGIASDPKKRLFEEHNVNEQSGQWIYDNAGSESTARTVEKYLIDTYGTQGGSGGGDENTTWVYSYKITTNTIE